MTEQNYKCDKCDYTTKRKYNLKIHNNKHIARQDILKCVVCCKYFKTRSHAIQHSMTAKHKIKRHDEFKNIANKLMVEYNQTDYTEGIINEANEILSSKVFIKIYKDGAI